MRSLLIVLLGFVFAGCKEELPPLNFRAPQQAQNTTTSTPQSTSILVVLPKTEPSTSSQPTETFYCELDGKPWLLAPEQKLQGLLLQRPGLSKEQPTTKLITIALQGVTKERLLLEITADTPTLDTIKLTLTTKDTVAKASTTLKEVEQVAELESSRLSFSFDVELQTLGSPIIRSMKGCRLQGVIVRSLEAEALTSDE
jgi:hypothetical protein